MANNKDFDFIKLFYDIKNVCLTPDHCGVCKGKACLVGYARASVGEAKKQDTDTLAGWYDEIPSYDINGGYEFHDAMEAIAHTLQQCRSCRDMHYKDCLVNIVRTCYEIIAFGDEQEFDGSALMYINEISKKNPKAAEILLEVYQSHQNPMEETL